MNSILKIIFLNLMAIISVSALNIYFSTFFVKKYKCIRVKLIWGIFYLWQLITMSEAFLFPAYVNLILNVVFLIITSFNFEGTFFHKIMFVIAYNSMWMMLEFIIGYIFISLKIDYKSQNILGSLSSKILLLILVFLLNKFFKDEKMKELPRKYNIALLLIPIGSMYVMYNLFMFSSEIHSYKYIYISLTSLLIIFFVNILIFRIYLKLSQDFELRRKNSVYKQEIEMYSKHILEKENSMLEYRKMKHDLKNQLIYLLNLIEEKECQKASEFLNRILKGETFDNIIIAQTDNLAIDAIVNYKYSLARKYGIKFKCKLNVPMRIPYDDTDLCIILGNALDNAIEGCMRSIKAEERYIDLIVHLDRKNLIILVKNSFDGKILKTKNGHLITTKKDNNNHGLGIDSIKRTTNKYHGTVIIDTENNCFKLKIVLYSNDI